MEEVRNAYKIVIGNHEGKRPLGRPRHRWDDNIRMEREIEWEGVYWVHRAQGRDQRQPLMNTVMKFRVPYKAGNFLSS
jgi:hypothetical protein